MKFDFIRDVATAVTLAFSTSIASAATFTLTFTEEASGVVATGDGSFSVDDLVLSFDGDFETTTLLFPSLGSYANLGSDLSVWNPVTADPLPFAFGGSPSGGNLDDVSSGDRVGWIDGSGGGGTAWNFYTPSGYNGSLLSVVSTFAGFTFGDLLLQGGTYELSYGENGTIKVIVEGVPPIPLPAGLPLLASGLGTIALVRRFRKKHA